MRTCLKMVLKTLDVLVLAWLILAACFWDHPKDDLAFYLLFLVSGFLVLYLTIRPVDNFLKFCFAGMAFYTWFSMTPSHDRNWVDYQAKLPIVKINQNHIHIKNLRHDLRYIQGGTLNWLEKQVDLNELTEVHFALVTFTEWRGLAHLFLSFNFNNRDFLAVSGEIRREAEETYSPFKGLFRKYEKMIVLGTEEDLIGLRLFDHKDPITFYPLDMSRDKAKTLLLSLLRDCQAIEAKPRFYNTLTQNCATLIEKHLEKVYQIQHPLDLRLIFPGYADQIGLDLDLIQPLGSLEKTREVYTLKNIDMPNVSGNAWSLKLRQKP